MLKIQHIMLHVLYDLTLTFSTNFSLNHMALKIVVKLRLVQRHGFDPSAHVRVPFACGCFLFACVKLHVRARRVASEMPPTSEAC